ncbi:MAG: hypothetical protein NTZ05_08310, partial [Chloroflexi bacterium]|nr:hypothetical protein [Chloroflexota bacterium]
MSLSLNVSVARGEGTAQVWPPNGWTVDTLTPTLRWSNTGYTHLWVQRTGATSPAVDSVFGPGINEHAPLISLTPGATYHWRIRSNPLSPSTSPFSWGPWSGDWTFATPARPASCASAAPSLQYGPANGAKLEQVNPTLTFKLPSEAQQVEVLLIPSYNPTAAVSIVRPAISELRLPAPPQWYGMLPGTTYYWRLRANNLAGAVPGDDPSWGPWTETWSFQTPMPSGSTVYPTVRSVTSLTPTLTWGDSTPTNFYYEVQLSRDSQFISDPFRATAMVYWEVRHGGMTTPPNSYTVPASYPLTPGVTYFWRVRPRSGDNPAAVPWSSTWSFVTPG